MVSDKQIRSLEYFKNRIVTFFVYSINRDFDEKQCVDYFVGKVTKLDEMGIWYEHVSNKCTNFIFYDKIVSISEEQVFENKDYIKTTESIQHVHGGDQLLSDNVKAPEDIDDFRSFIS